MGTILFSKQAKNDSVKACSTAFDREEKMSNYCKAAALTENDKQHLKEIRKKLQKLGKEQQEAKRRSLLSTASVANDAASSITAAHSFDNIANVIVNVASEHAQKVQISCSDDVIVQPKSSKSTPVHLSGNNSDTVANHKKEAGSTCFDIVMMESKDKRHCEGNIEPASNTGSDPVTFDDDTVRSTFDESSNSILLESVHHSICCETLCCLQHSYTIIALQKMKS